MTQFEIGKRYGMNSICDSDCWWYYTVIARTACTVTLKSDRGEIVKCRISKGISEIYGAEAVRPLGTFSMCPTLTAEKTYEKVAEQEQDVEEPESLDEEPVKDDEPKAVVVALNAQPKAVKSFVIYQLPTENNATFMGLDFVREHGIMPKLEDYSLIYCGEIERDATLDDVYMKFNMGARPANYHGRSLSVSDVVLMDGEYNYCDSYGWEPVNF